MKVKLTNDGIRTDYGANLLRARGIQDIEKFLKPDESCMQSWEDLSGIGLGVGLIQRLAPDARIGLVVDCDVDGFTSASIIYQYLMRHSPDYQITPYIHDGKAHGLEEHWREIAEADYNLVIVPDAGTNDSWYADEIKVPILVIDHHLYEGENAPSNWMILINNQLCPFYRNKNLSGAGMAYQFCRAMDSYLGHNWADDYMDLAALGVCADMMSGLEVENQYLWRKGFANPRNGMFWAFARKQAYGITGKVDPTDEELIEALNPVSVAFYIVPLINAMIRVGAQSEKEELFEAFIHPYKDVLSTKKGTKGEIVYLANEVARKCTNARTHQNKALDDAVALAEQKIYKHDLLANKVLFIRLDDEDRFPSELNGLLAMKLSQKFRHPTMVGRLGPDGYIKGSIRGLSNCELTSFKDFLTSSSLFQYVQGHDNAAGFALPAKSLDSLHSYANETLASLDFNSDYFEVDFERHALDKDLPDIIVDLDKYTNCWAQQNPTPLIHITDLHFRTDEVQIMGKNKDTIKVVKNGVAYMKFFAKDLINELKQYGDIRMEIVGKPNLNYWGNTCTPQIFIEAYQIQEDRLIDF